MVALKVCREPVETLPVLDTWCVCVCDSVCVCVEEEGHQQEQAGLTVTPVGYIRYYNQEDFFLLLRRRRGHLTL